MAYDAARGQVVLFGGSGEDVVGDTWTWDGTDWTQRFPAHAPASRELPGMAYDAADGETVLFGGAAGEIRNDTWTWDGTDWTKQAPAHSPAARYIPGMGYDASNEQIVLFGGFNIPNHDYGHTWTWDGTDWTKRFPAHSPNARHGHGMSADAAGGVVLFGGFAGRGFGDTWEWNGTDWKQRPAGSITLTPNSGPPGQIVRVQGWGFAAGERVQLRFLDSVHGKTLLSTLHSDGTGAFAVDATIPVGATPGTQRVKAHGALSGQVAKVPFRVVVN
jgi:hypothetical protein